MNTVPTYIMFMNMSLLGQIFQRLQELSAESLYLTENQLDGQAPLMFQKKKEKKESSSRKTDKWTLPCLYGSKLVFGLTCHNIAVPQRFLSLIALVGDYVEKFGRKKNYCQKNLISVKEKWEFNQNLKIN